MLNGLWNWLRRPPPEAPVITIPEDQRLHDWNQLFKAVTMEGLPPMFKQAADVQPIWPNPWHKDCAMVAQVIMQLKQRLDEPIDMVLHCPQCHAHHIDQPHGTWTNPPHRSHLCANCHFIWRPADVPTNGVLQVTTRGKEDQTYLRPETVAMTQMCTTDEEARTCRFMTVARQENRQQHYACNRWPHCKRSYWQAV